MKSKQRVKVQHGILTLMFMLGLLLGMSATVWADGSVPYLAWDADRQKVVEQFREWIYALKKKYEPLTISVLCHSFGTYIITKYIEGFASAKGHLPIQIDTLILTGSIIKPDYDWNEHIPLRVGRVLNIVAGGDDAVKYMPEGGWKKIVGMASLFGQGAIEGIKNVSSKVENLKLEILTHTNIFKDDVIEQYFLPYFNANNGIAHREAMEEIVKR